LSCLPASFVALHLPARGVALHLPARGAVSALRAPRDGARMLGLLNRDIFERAGPASLEWPGSMLQIKDFMLRTEQLVTLRTDMRLADAAHIMVNNDITGCPVLDSRDALVGILSRTDLINQIAGRAKLSLHGPKSLRYMQNHRLLQNVQEQQVRDVMTPRPETVLASSTMQEAAAKMARMRLNRLMVVDKEEGGSLVGMVSSSDVVRLALCGKEAAEEEKDGNA